MAEMGPTQSVHRMSCNGTMIRLRINPDSAWITIDRPGHEPFYRDIDQSEVAGVLAEFKAIGESPEKFTKFVENFLAICPKGPIRSQALDVGLTCPDRGP